MTKKQWGMVAASILLVCIGVTAIWRAPTRNTRPLGEHLYAESCARCHGVEGQGGIGMALDSTGHMYQHTYSQLKLHIAIGSRGSGFMPSFHGKLSPGEMTTIVTSFQHWWTDEQIAEFQRVNTDLRSNL